MPREVFWQGIVIVVITNKKEILGLSSRANYTDRATPLVGEVSANFLRIESIAW
jgi:hypothetical protein